MKTYRVAMLSLVLVAVLLLSGCARGGSSAEGDGLHKTAPDVVGLSQSEASARIVDAGYEVGSVTEEPGGENANRGEVIRQDPVAGTSLPRGAEISLVIAGD